MLSVKLEIGAEIRRADGTVRKNVPFRQCHCLVKGFIQLLYAQMAGSNVTIKDTSGTNRTEAAHAYNLLVAYGTQTTQGILIGTGTTAVTIADYNLAQQITSNIEHQTATFAIENPDSETWRLAISRGFVNNTGTDQDIKEVGLVAGFSSNVYKILIDRTLYNATVAIGETLTLTYRISVTL